MRPTPGPEAKPSRIRRRNTPTHATRHRRRPATADRAGTLQPGPGAQQRAAAWRPPNPPAAGRDAEPGTRDGYCRPLARVPARAGTRGREPKAGTPTRPAEHRRRYADAGCEGGRTPQTLREQEATECRAGQPDEHEARNRRQDAAGPDPGAGDPVHRGRGHRPPHDRSSGGAAAGPRYSGGDKADGPQLRRECGVRTRLAAFQPAAAPSRDPDQRGERPVLRPHGRHVRPRLTTIATERPRPSTGHVQHGTPPPEARR